MTIQKFRYQYEIQLNLETLGELENIVMQMFDNPSQPVLYLETNTRLLKEELLQVSINSFTVELEFTRIIRYKIKCDQDSRHFIDSSNDISYFSCKANALMIYE